MKSVLSSQAELPSNQTNSLRLTVIVVSSGLNSNTRLTVRLSAAAAANSSGQTHRLAIFSLGSYRATQSTEQQGGDCVVTVAGQLDTEVRPVTAVTRPPGYSTHHTLGSDSAKSMEQARASPNSFHIILTARRVLQTGCVNAKDRQVGLQHVFCICWQWSGGGRRRPVMTAGLYGVPL